MGVIDRLANAWNVFRAKDRRDEVENFSPVRGSGSFGTRSYARRSFISNERTTIASIYNRIAIDVAAVFIRHVKLDSNGRYLEDVNSGLNECMNTSANIDQAGSAFRQDIAQTLCEEGVLAVVPVDTDKDPNFTDGFDIKSMRVGLIVDWFPGHVLVDTYDERDGKRHNLFLDKRKVAVIENPLYSVMNEPNSTLKRITRKLSLLDSVDDAASSGKLDIIMQLPYTIKSEARKDQAETRRAELETQLKDSKYGVAYTDGTERITQLNRPAENNMLNQIKWLTEKLYAELGLAEAVFNGTASEAVMLNYRNRTIEPILRAITEAMHRSFLSKTARTQGHAVRYFPDLFKLVPISQMAEIGDKFTRNAILSSNEVRGIIGFKPVLDDPEADKLVNKNMPQNGDSHEKKIITPVDEEDPEEEKRRLEEEEETLEIKKTK